MTVMDPISQRQEMAKALARKIRHETTQRFQGLLPWLELQLEVFWDDAYQRGFQTRIRDDALMKEDADGIP